MEANNLTISVPTPTCLKNCSYCVTKMTGIIPIDLEKFRRSLYKAMKLADNMNVSNVLVTGKGEPLDNICEVKKVAEKFADYPLEIQVNGDRYYQEPKDKINILDRFDVIALSFDKLPASFVKRNRSIMRMTLIVHDGLTENFNDIIDYCKYWGIDQLSLRNPTVPEKTNNTGEAVRARQWIKKNTKEDNYSKLINHFINRDDKTVLRRLNFGATVYDVDGISFTYFDYCVQDQANYRDIRSLILMEDGHIYTSWSYKSSKII